MFLYDMDYKYKPNIMFKDISDLIVNFEYMFNDLKSRYPVHFEYPFTSDNSGYMSKYTDSRDENEILGYTGNKDYDVVYQGLQLEYALLPQTEA